MTKVYHYGNAYWKPPLRCFSVQIRTLSYSKTVKSGTINLQSNNLMPHEAFLKGIPGSRARDPLSRFCGNRSRAFCLTDNDYENEKGHKNNKMQI